MRRARSALGLRGRITAVVLLTAVATLAVAAVALLGPLEHSLRNAEQTTLREELGKDPTGTFRRPWLCLVYSNPVAATNLRHAEVRLGSRLGGVAVILGYPGRNGEESQPLSATGSGHGAYDPALPSDRFSDAAAAFRTGHVNSSVATIGGTEYARRVIPFTRACPEDDHHDRLIRYVLAVRKSIAEIPAVARVVRRAFLDAALAGLALTLLLGIPLSFRLVARLRRLREVAIEAQHGAAALVPADTANDEVGDLARSLASMQRRLRRQEEARRAFVATASHELRTPLASLDGMLELLGEDLADDESDVTDARALLDRARAQSRRLGRLAADLLDLSRIDAEVELRSEPVELGELSRAVLAEFELGTRERSLRCILEGQGGDPVWALGDPGSVARILRILLDNAVRVGPPGTEIAVSLVRDDDVCIRVRDQGPGVRPEEREAIFQRFRRGRDTAGQAGFGLGLAIGRELARRMGGDLVLDPVLGAGACFTLRLPVARAALDDAVAID
jgi:signal transduction histidine kinase